MREYCKNGHKLEGDNIVLSYKNIYKNGVFVKRALHGVRCNTCEHNKYLERVRKAKEREGRK